MIIVDSETILKIKMKTSKAKNKSVKVINPKRSTATGPGRPSYSVKWPKGKFTFQDLCELNGVNFETGKGKFCTKLTLRKHLAADAARKGKSLIVQLDESREPSSANGLGRKVFVYISRESQKAASDRKAAKASVNVGTAKESTKAPAKTPRATKGDKVSVQTQKYEALKANITDMLGTVKESSTIPTDGTPIMVVAVMNSPTSESENALETGFTTETTNETDPAPAPVAEETSATPVESADPVEQGLVEAGH